MSLQLLLSSRQQLLCSCCYALCNEHYCVCSPLADVIHSGDGVLCLCHVEVSNSSLSGMFVIYHCVVNTFHRYILISMTYDLYAVNGAPNMCQDKKRPQEWTKHYRHTYCGHTVFFFTKGMVDPFGQNHC